MKKCPFCSEEIQSEAIKCRYCAEWLNTKSTNDVVSDEQLKSQEKLRGQDYSLHETSKVEPPSVSSPRQNTTVTPLVEKPKEKAEDFIWQCPRCKKINPITLFKCPCGKIVQPYEQKKYRTNKPIEQIIICLNWKCPRCSKINDKSLFKCSCGYIVGLWEQTKYAAKVEPSPEPPPVSLPQQSTTVTPPIEKKNEKSYKSLSWKSFIIAFVIAVVINIIASAVAGTKPAKNIVWTTMWIYLTIEAWKYWKWKALLPYPIFLLTSITTTMILLSVGMDYRGWTDLIVRVALNIGGLTIFYAIFRK